MQPQILDKNKRPARTNGRERNNDLSVLQLFLGETFTSGTGDEIKARVDHIREKLIPAS